MITTAALRQMLTYIQQAVPNPLLDVNVHLYKAPLTLTPTTTPAQLQEAEADFDGYAPVIVDPVGFTWDDANGNALVSFMGVHFQPSSNVTPNTIYGWWMTQVAPGAFAGFIMRMKEFPTPIPMGSVVDALDFTPTFAIGPIEGDPFAS